MAAMEFLDASAGTDHAGFSSTLVGGPAPLFRLARACGNPQNAFRRSSEKQSGQAMYGEIFKDSLNMLGMKADDFSRTEVKPDGKCGYRVTQIALHRNGDPSNALIDFVLGDPTSAEWMDVHDIARSLGAPDHRMHGRRLLVVRMVVECDKRYPLLEVRAAFFLDGVAETGVSRRAVIAHMRTTDDPIVLSYEVRNHPHAGDGEYARQRHFDIVWSDEDTRNTRLREDVIDLEEGRPKTSGRQIDALNMYAQSGSSSNARSTADAGHAAKMISGVVVSKRARDDGAAELSRQAPSRARSPPLGAWLLEGEPLSKLTQIQCGVCHLNCRPGEALCECGDGPWRSRSEPFRRCGQLYHAKCWQQQEELLGHRIWVCENCRCAPTRIASVGEDPRREYFVVTARNSHDPVAEDTCNVQPVDEI
jgi:hypothetical protein